MVYTIKTVVMGESPSTTLALAGATPMADVHTPAQRSYNMSCVRSKDTKPELIVRKLLHANGFRYRLHDKNLPGKPDIVLPKYKTVIFVHGCRYAGSILPFRRR